MTYKMLTNHENSFNVIKKLSPIMTPKLHYSLFCKMVEKVFRPLVKMATCQFLALKI